jgi:O-antigen/teichoic acid export membrane protein
VERYLGERELGIFAAIGYIMTAGTTVDNALGESATPQLANRFAAGKRKAFRRLLLQIVGIGILLGIAGVSVALVAGRPILTLLYSPEYGEHVNLFVLLMAASGVSYIASFLGYGITAARYFRVKMYLLIVVLAATALASFTLIPTHGLHGAALTIMISRLVQAVGSVIILGYILRKASKHSREELRQPTSGG